MCAAQLTSAFWDNGVFLIVLSYARLFVARLLCPCNSPGKNTEVGCHSFLQGIFPTQRSNMGLLHCRQILYHWVTWEASNWLSIKEDNDTYFLNFLMEKCLFFPSFGGKKKSRKFVHSQKWSFSWSNCEPAPERGVIASQSNIRGYGGRPFLPMTK